MSKSSSSFATPYSIPQGIPQKAKVRHRGKSTFEEQTILGESDTDDSERVGADLFIRQSEASPGEEKFVRRCLVADIDEMPNLRLALRRGDKNEAHLVVENKTKGGAAVVDIPAGSAEKAKKLLAEALKKADLDLDKMDYDHPDARVAGVTLTQRGDELSAIKIDRSIPYPYLDYSSDHPIDRKDPNVRKHDFEIMKYGFPGIEHPIFRNSTVLSYNAQHKTANWVAEKLTKYTMTGDADRSQAGFKAEADSDIAPEHKAKLSDYKNSGFDRGHLAPAADHSNNQEDMDETFLLANISPQVGSGFNQQYWKSLEQKVREWSSGDDELYVVTGPAYLSEDGARKKKREVSYQVIGDGEVAVPTHYFKAMLSEHPNADGSVDVRTQAFLIPNTEIDKEQPLEKFLVSVDDLEKKTGLDFFNRLPDKLEDELEAETPKALWGDDGWHKLA